MKFRKKPVVIEATQWFKNGDHPLDYVGDFDDPISSRRYSAEFRREEKWEGDIVRYFRHPDISGEKECTQCGKTMHVHGWIDTLEGGHIVCPGDWIITGVQGENYPCKPDIFEATYEAAEPSLTFQARCEWLSLLDLTDVIIAVDFDGTCVMHDFPNVGADVPGSAEVLRALDLAGAKLIVWTIRSDQAKIKNDPHSLANGTAGQELDKAFLLKAIDWFTDRGIRLYGHNCNPQQGEWSSSPKCYAHAYIDDAALGCPLIHDTSVHSRPYVDWDAMSTLLVDRFGGHKEE